MTILGEIDLPSNYGWVLVLEILISFECVILNYIAGGGARSRNFTKEYLSEHFSETFRNELNKEPDQGGFPDMGDGRLSKHLTFSQWYDFNNAQRASYNFVEQVYFPLICIPIAGLYLDIATIALASAYFLGRLLYAIAYIKYGPSKRMIGGSITDVALLGFPIAAFISVFYLEYN